VTSLRRSCRSRLLEHEDAVRDHAKRDQHATAVLVVEWRAEAGGVEHSGERAARSPVEVRTLVQLPESAIATGAVAAKRVIATPRIHRLLI